MSFIASARRYRPQLWADVMGQPVTRRILQNAVSLSRIAPAYIFEGQRGCGKTSIARLFAKTLNCARKAPEPCNECASCVGITESRDTEVLELDAASNRGIDDARALQRVAQQQPRDGAYRIVILDEAHMLTKEAQNALLALFESPPDRFLPILCTTEAEKILPTIRSRCSIFQIRPLSQADIAQNLRMIFSDAKQPIDESVLFALSRVSNGSLRDVQQLADQLILCAEGENIDDAFAEAQTGVPTVELFKCVVSALAQAWEQGPAVWFEAVEALHDDGSDLHSIYFQVIPTVLRDLRISIVSRGLPSPVVPYDSGIPHASFEARNRFAHADLDALFEAWEDLAVTFGQLSEKNNVEFFFLKAWDKCRRMRP